jgi:DNA-binding NarL/FixJ family response regulator
MGSVIEVVVVDNHKIIREAIETLLEKYDRITVVETVDYQDAAQRLAVIQPRVALLNLGTNGNPERLKRIQEIQRLSPDTQILILANSVDDLHLFQALKFGAHGFLLKGSGANELIESICELSEGGAHLPPQISRRVPQKISHLNNNYKRDIGRLPLSPQQIRVLKLISRGHTNAEIAQMLVISKRTVEMHTYKMFKRLSVRNRTEALQAAIRIGIIDFHDIEAAQYQFAD